MFFGKMGKQMFRVVLLSLAVGCLLQHTPYRITRYGHSSWHTCVVIFIHICMYIYLCLILPSLWPWYPQIQSWQDYWLLVARFIFNLFSEGFFFFLRLPAGEDTVAAFRSLFNVNIWWKLQILKKIEKGPVGAVPGLKGTLWKVWCRRGPNDEGLLLGFTTCPDSFFPVSKGLLFTDCWQERKIHYYCPCGWPGRKLRLSLPLKKIFSFWL